MNIDKFEHAGLIVRIMHDDQCESPLPDDGDNGVNITYKRGSRYVLGNQQVDGDEFEEITSKIESGEYIGLPVYAYIHSGVALRVGSSWHGLLPQGHAEFDSGLSGVVYISRKDALAWWMRKRMTKATRAKMEKGLTLIVAEFSRYLNGECYGYVIETENGEHVDSCFGFIGYEYVTEEAKRAAADAAEQRAQDREEDAVTHD